MGPVFDKQISPCQVEQTPPSEDQVPALFREISLPVGFRKAVSWLELTEGQEAFRDIREEQRKKEALQNGSQHNNDKLEYPSLRNVLASVREVFQYGRSVSKKLTWMQMGVSVLVPAQGALFGVLIGQMQSQMAQAGGSVLGWGATVTAAAAALFATTFYLDKYSEAFMWRFWQRTFNRFDRCNASRPFGLLQDKSTNEVLRDLKQNQWRLFPFFQGTFGGLGALAGGGVAVSVLATTYSPLMAGLLAAAIIPRLAFDFASSHLHDAFERKQSERGDMIEAYRDHLADHESNRDLQMNHAIPEALNRVEATRDDAMKRRFRFLDANFRRRVLAAAPIMATGLVTLGMITIESSAGILSSSSLPACIGATTAAVMAGISLSNAWGMLVQQHGYVRRILRFLNVDNGKQRIETTSNPDTSISLAPGIKVENITVKNEGEEKPRLSDVGIDIALGSFVGIVGERGAGKTTLLKVLLKEIVPAYGKVFVTPESGETKEISQLRSDEWHHHISCLYQDAPKFEGLTVREAVTLGREIPEEQLLRVMEITGLLGVAQISRDQLTDSDQVKAKEARKRLNGFLDQKIGEKRGGRDFSGGELRLIAISRALVQPHPIVILDEPGEGMDPTNELEMLRRIRSSCKEAGRTLIVVSHRYGTLLDADQILVMKEGGIEARGTHKHLLKAEVEADGSAKPSTYRDAYLAQLRSLLPGLAVELSPEGDVVIR